MYLHAHLPGPCPSLPRRPTIARARFPPSEPPRRFVCADVRKVCFPGAVGIFPFRKPICVPLRFSQHPAPVGEHFNYPEHFTANSHFAAIHLCLRLWAASAVFIGYGEGASGALSWLIKQPLINPELELIKLQTSECDDTFRRKPSLCYQLLKYRLRDVVRDLEAPLDTSWNRL